ncbi:hypothetical protein [Sulfitobacter geojensis]|uniref:hypothetical protein n=1 Tax=Sulfitobacter geojensis TaxID=1342299 RepID=UPI003B8D988A
MNTLTKISRLGRALQWFTPFWVAQLLLWAAYVWLFNFAETDGQSFTAIFLHLLKSYGWIPFAAGLCLRALCAPWIETAGGRSNEPQPGGTY